MASQVKMEPLDPWVPEELLVREDGQGFQELRGLAVMTVLAEVMDSQAPLAPLELQDSPVPPVLRVKLDLRDPPAQAGPPDKEENLDLRATLVRRVLRALLGAVVVPVAKAKWVLLAFLELLD